MSNPRIYVACLAAYNNGYHHGVWVDATQEADAIQAAVDDMLAESPVPDAEEWAIHDYDEFGSVRIQEFETFETVHHIAKAVQAWPDVVVADCLECGVEPENLTAEIQERFCGTVDEELDELSALTRYILDEDEFWDGLPERFQVHSRAIAESEANDRLKSGDVYALHGGPGTWHLMYSA